eukprot:6207948-Pleurochrysis_carterae.AAC.1
MHVSSSRSLNYVTGAHGSAPRAALGAQRRSDEARYARGSHRTRSFLKAFLEYVNAESLYRHLESDHW